MAEVVDGEGQQERCSSRPPPDFALADLTGRELVRQPLPKELVDQELTVAPR